MKLWLVSGLQEVYSGSLLQQTVYFLITKSQSGGVYGMCTTYLQTWPSYVIGNIRPTPLYHTLRILVGSWWFLDVSGFNSQEIMSQLFGTIILDIIAYEACLKQATSLGVTQKIFVHQKQDIPDYMSCQVCNMRTTQFRSSGPLLLLFTFEIFITNIPIAVIAILWRLGARGCRRRWWHRICNAAWKNLGSTEYALYIYDIRTIYTNILYWSYIEHIVFEYVWIHRGLSHFLHFYQWHCGQPLQHDEPPKNHPDALRSKYSKTCVANSQHPTYKNGSL